MKNKKYFPVLFLWAVYVGLLAICISLSISTYHTLDSHSAYQSIAINLAMFLIIGGWFVYCTNKFIKVIHISEEVESAAIKIKEDFLNGDSLWEKYSNNSEELFHIDSLRKKYIEFVAESKRFAELTNGSYKCKIDDFINEDYLNSTMNKTLCNIVPGFMTGLGILGTFIGLSLGLQAFNTGSASEIADSIAPLMGGIKIAFHTSVYGMIFSLVFNWIFKAISVSSMEKLNDFLMVYDEHVLFDSVYTNESEALNLIRKMPEEIGKHLSSVLAPAMTGISETFKAFADNVSEKQTEGLSNIVDSFVDSMNASLGDSFTKLGKIIEATCEMQEKNNENVQKLLEKIRSMAIDIDKINEISNSTVEKMSAYIDKLDEYQNSLNKSHESLNAQIEKQSEIDNAISNNMKELSEQQKVIVEITTIVSSDLEKQIANLSELEKNLSEEAKENMEQLAAQAYDYNEQIADFARDQLEKMAQYSDDHSASMMKSSEELAKVVTTINEKFGNSLTDTFKAFDSNLAEITDHLSGTISEVDDTTKRVPSVVNAAYSGMEKGFNEIQNKMDAFVKILDEDIKKRQIAFGIDNE